MAPERAPAFQFYPKDFLTDGNVAGMSLQERGAYISLLCLCWLERSVPDDIGRLANLVGVPRPVMARLWPAISRCFRTSQSDPSRLIHPRLEIERDKQEEFRRRQSDAGKWNRKPTGGQPEGNRGSTEQQPKPNSPISHLRSPKRTRAAAAPRSPVENVRVITAMVHAVLQTSTSNDYTDLKEETKRQCALAHIAYDADVVGRALESALAQRRPH